MLVVSDISLFSDRDITAYAPHYYQEAAEMGDYGYKTEDFSNLLKALPVKKNPSAAFTPGKMKVGYDSTLAAAAYKWLQTKGDRFIYIYGGIDTWSDTAVPPAPNVDASWFFMPQHGHGCAKIRNMSAGEKNRLIEDLNRWLLLNIKNDTGDLNKQD